jgi:hypothetical protein
MTFIESLEATTITVLIAAGIIIVLTLFAKFIHIVLKCVIIAVMLLIMLYFLRQAGAL